MQILDVESFAISIPLDEPAVFSAREVAERDHAIVRVQTDSGVTGVGYTLGYDAATLIASAVEELLAPLVVGEDPFDTTRLWRRLFDSTVHTGRKGIVLRAISILDIALWDIKAKAADQPLYKYLGARTNAPACYASGGYYNEGDDVEQLREEMTTYVDRGHDAVKIKVGNVPLSEDIERVAAARECLGEERALLLDATCAWSTKRDALEACRAFAAYDPYFIEEPVMPDSVSLMSEVNAALEYPVAAGELEATRYGFAQLLSERAVDIVQPDATVVGGITEWLRIVNTAATWDVPVAPHYNHNLHAQLVASIENGLWVEYFYRDIDIVAFDDVVVDPVVPGDDGTLELPDRSGHGVELDEKRLESVRVTGP